MNDPEALVSMIKQESRWIAGAVLGLALLYILVIRLTSRPSTAASDSAA
jgi:hypothetical protein